MPGLNLAAGATPHPNARPQVTVFAPLPRAHYLCVTLDNILQVGAVAAAALCAVLCPVLLDNKRQAAVCCAV